jgi:RNA-dependent RNA polymerase
VDYLKGRTPSGFQIRFNGYKGVVAVDERMRGGNMKLRLRPSMRKFDCDHYYVEVCKTTSLMPGFLNRQIITLLSTLGVPDRVFLNKQDLILKDLDKLLYDSRVRQIWSNRTSCCLIALCVLQTAISHLKHSCNPSPNSVLGGAVKMMSSGFDMSEPYLQGILQAHRLAQLQDVRDRSRIFLKNGACLMGVIDESRTLTYNQVFLKVTDPGHPERAPRVVEGLVAIAKNPCFHPGDVRSLEAVDVPALRHLVDCLVFPTFGPRPRTDECSGSDLDGDLYFVTWDEELIPPKSKRNQTPMDYQGITPKPIVHPRPIRTPDLHEFFINYIKNDQLGPIANAHVVWADYSPEKAFNEKCLKLAELHSVAVDYPKTGVPANMAGDLRPPFYPNFMHKRDRVQYESQSILGKLYAQYERNFGPELRTNESYYNPSTDFDPALVIGGCERYIREAVALRDRYNHELRAIMTKYDITNEFQALTGDVLRVSRKLRRSRLSDLRLQIRREVRELLKSYRVAFDRDATLDFGTSSRLQRASAWYCVTYSPKLRPELTKLPGRRRRDPKPLLSFPWILHDWLCELKNINSVSRF